MLCRYIFTEGDLRRALEILERKRIADGKAYCIQINVVGQVVHSAEGYIIELSPEIISDMRKNGQLDFAE